MTYSKLFSKEIPCGQIVDDIKRAIEKIYPLSATDYNSDLFHDIAIGFKSIVFNMEMETTNAFPLFLKWLKLYVRLQHQIDSNDKKLISKFERRIPVCTSYIVASLQYQTKIANYHLQVMEMCLELFNSSSPEIMKTIANLEIEIIALFWMPIEFVGDYNTQKLSLKLIIKVLKYLSEPDRRKKVAEIERSQDIRNLLLKLSINDDNFEKISRELLNTFNMANPKSSAVFSVYCTTVLFGSFELFKPMSADKFWIDFNYTSKSVSFLCQINKSPKDKQELSIQIKIDNLQIDNQFDCIIVSMDPAIFSTAVSTELENARIAVFTLAQNEIERLKANRDLLNFYKSYSNSESDIPPTPTTIEKYLAESDFSETPYSQDSQILLPPKILPEVMPPVENLNNVSINQSKPHLPTKGSITPTNSRRKTNPSPNAMSSLNVLSTKESGYNTGLSTIKEDSTIFKKPTKPVRRQTKHKPPGKVAQPVVSRRSTENPKSPLRLEDKSTPTPKSISRSDNASRRFFKPKTIKQASTPPKKPKKTTRKRLANTEDTGISPKRKQVNTVKPLDHLTKPDCDPEEAALEYVENGGYDNIITFLRSKLGATCFNEEQRQQIIENIERINEGIERSTQHFFQKDSNTETDGDSIWRPTAMRKTKAVPRVAQVANFVPYSTWKMKQKEKTSAQSTMLSLQPPAQNQHVPVTKPANISTMISAQPPQHQQPAIVKTSMNPFDQLKVSSSKLQHASTSKLNTSQNITTGNSTAVADNRSCSSSDSSCSNHNYLIAESGNEMVDESSDEEILPVDMMTRREPEEMELSPIAVPTEVSQMKSISLPPDDMDIFNPAQYQVDPRTSYQMSEIFEDFDEIPPAEHFQDTEQPVLVANSTSDKSQPRSVYSPITTTIPRDVHTESERDQETMNTWYVHKYLEDQQLYDQSSRVSPTCFDPLPDDEQSPLSRPQNITTNQVFIQNQIVLSTIRKRTHAADDHEESPLVKKSSIGDRVPLRGYAQLMPNYMGKLTNEKDRLLKELERELQQDFFENFNEIADEVMKSMAEHEAAINEAQEQLSFIFGKLEWLIENQQKNKSQLESIYCQLIGRIKASLPRKEEIVKAYEEVAEKLSSYSATTSGDLWQNFAKTVVNSIADRLGGLVHL